MNRIRLKNTGNESELVSRIICRYIRVKTIICNRNTGEINIDGIILRPVTTEDVIILQSGCIDKNQYIDLEVDKDSVDYLDRGLLTLELIPRREIEIVHLPSCG